MKDNVKWNALINCDEKYDGLFYYGVTSVKAFCKPSCKSKTPLRKNTVYFNSIEDALTQGYRPCKRCRPDLDKYNPNDDLVKNINLLIEKYYCNSQKLLYEINNLGISKNHASKLYKSYYNKTIKQYIDELKLKKTQELLLNNKLTILDIADSVDFKSISAFYAFFKKYTNLTPNKFKRTGK